MPKGNLVFVRRSGRLQDDERDRRLLAVERR
jgi:hypothetical protein